MALRKFPPRRAVPGLDGGVLHPACREDAGNLVDSTNFWLERQGKHLVILAYLYQTTEPNAAWTGLRPHLQTLRLAVENHRA